MNRFAWGKVIDYISLDFDGQVMEIVKYHPYKEFGRSKEIDESRTEYHCEELHASATTMFGIVLQYIVEKQLGHNQHQLVAGLFRMLEIGCHVVDGEKEK